MLKIVIIGTGNISYHLCKAIIETKNLKLIEVFGRKKNPPKDLFNNISYCNNIKKIQKADLYILCVSDNAISKISDELNINKNSIVVHTSGSTNMKLLSKHKNHGIIYPLQTFTSNANVNFSEIPICIETYHQEDLLLLQELGKSISNNVQIVTSTQREHIHLSAVIVNNFVNHLYLIGQDLLVNQSLTFDILKPLIFETATKIKNISPHKTQTGPAKRNDLKTIEKQLHLLKDSPYQELYKNITNSILEKYKH